MSPQIENLISKYDKENLLGVFKDFSKHIKAASQNGVDFGFVPHHIVYAGMGGSALGGQMFADFPKENVPYPIVVHRDYGLPSFAGKDSLVIAASYSGNTEETLHAYDEAKKRGIKTIVITSGGKLLELAKANNDELIIVPTGFQPRVSWMYFILPLLDHFNKLGYTNIDLDSLPKFAEGLLAKYLGDDAYAFELAKKIHGKIPVFYSSVGVSTIAYKWKINLNEHAKNAAFANIFPELNHNEMVGMKNPTSILSEKMVLFMLKTDFDGVRNNRRQDVTAEVLGDKLSEIVEVKAEGTTKIEQVFSLMFLAELVGYFVALLNEEDPTPVALVEDFKKMLLDKHGLV